MNTSNTMKKKTVHKNTKEGVTQQQGVKILSEEIKESKTEYVYKTG